MPAPSTLTEPLEVGKAVCGAKKRSTGDPCQLRAGLGTDHVGWGNCKHHGGSTTTGKKSAARLEAKAHGEHIARVMGFATEVDPFDALLECIWIAKGEVVYCSERIAELGEDEAVVTFAERSETDGIVKGESEHSVSTKTSTVAELNIWIVARRDAVDRMARYAKMAIDAGIAERQVQIAERVGGMIGRLVSSVLDELELTAGQRELAPMVMRKHLTAIAGGSAA